MKVPNFFIVGAPKCGTTALSEYLREHPNIYVSQPKEPHYFAEDFGQYRRIKDLHEYLALFRQTGEDHLAVGEASVWYLYSSVALRNIYEFNKDAKIIVMLRNPVDMVYSLHSQTVFTFFDDESDFETSWRLQSIRKQGERIPKSCLEPSFLQYKEVAEFSNQLERLFAIFPRKQVKVILMEDFSSSTGDVYNDVLSFLELPQDGRRDFPKINVNKAHRRPWLGKFLYHPPYPVRWLEPRIRKIFTAIGVRKSSVWHWLLSLSTSHVKRPALSDEFRSELRDEFTDDIHRLSAILERDLTHWIEGP